MFLNIGLFSFKIVFCKFWKYPENVHSRIVVSGFSTCCSIMSWHLMPFLNPLVVFSCLSFSISFYSQFPSPPLPRPSIFLTPFLALPYHSLPWTSRCLHKHCSALLMALRERADVSGL